MTPITNIVFDITLDCNFQCRYPCFVYKEPKRATKEVCSQLINFLLSVAPPGQPVSIGFFGGEPLLEWDLMAWTMEEGLKRAAMTGREIGFSVTTNGSLLTEDRIKFLASHKCGVLFSIDGPPEVNDLSRVYADGRGTFKDIAQAAKLVVAYKNQLPNLTARVTWNPEFHQRGREVAEFLVDMGFPDVAICPVEEADYEKVWDEYCQSEHELADFFIERTLQRRMPPLSFTTRYLSMIWQDNVLGNYQPQVTLCGAGRGMLGCDPEGNLYPCHRFPETPFLRKFKLGDIWHGLNWDEKAKYDLLNIYQFQFPYDCRTCEVWPYCGPPCIGVNGDFSGTIFRSVKGRCLWHKAHVKECKRIHETLKDDPYYRQMAGKGFMPQSTGPVY